MKNPNETEANPALETASPLFCNLDAHRVTLQAIIDHSPAEIYLKDLEGRYLLVNRKFCDRVATDPTQVIGKRPRDFFSPSETEQFVSNDQAVLTDGKASQFEETITLEDGVHTLLTDKFPLRDEHGTIYAVCGISSDITSRKNYEKNLRQLNSRIQQQGRTLETVLSASPSIVYMFDSQGRFLYANHAGAANFGVRPVDIIGKTWNSLKLAEGAFEPFMTQISQVFRTGKTIRGDLIIPTVDGSREYAYTLIPIMDIRGRVVNVIAYVNDVTRDREKDRALKQRAHELSRSNQELEQFAKIASRDLNEPLILLQRYLNQLEKDSQGDLREEQTKFLDLAIKSAGKMKVLVNDLVDYARIGKVKEPFKKVNMRDLLSQVKRELMAAINEPGMSISANSLPVVWGDETQLRLLLKHLVSNGLKYNRDPQPKVQVSVDRKSDRWVFEVKDNGIGINSSDCDRIFEVSHRLHHRTEYPGTGIGLALCRKIVIQHDGTIWVNSISGEGSSFYFSLPIHHKGADQMTIDLVETG